MACLSIASAPDGLLTAIFKQGDPIAPIAPSAPPNPAGEGLPNTPDSKPNTRISPFTLRLRHTLQRLRLRHQLQTSAAKIEDEVLVVRQGSASARASKTVDTKRKGTRRGVRHTQARVNAARSARTWSALRSDRVQRSRPRPPPPPAMSKHISKNISKHMRLVSGTSDHMS